MGQTRMRVSPKVASSRLVMSGVHEPQRGAVESIPEIPHGPYLWEVPGISIKSKHQGIHKTYRVRRVPTGLSAYFFSPAHRPSCMHC